MRLDIPWISQLGPAASYGTGDCGFACVTMLVRYLTEHEPSVDDVAKRKGMPAGFRSAHIVYDLVPAAQMYGVRLRWDAGVTVEDLLEDLQAGRPAIALVKYDALPTRYDKRYNNNHYIVVAGATENHVVYHDPYWPPEYDRGQFMMLHQHAFIRAWASNLSSVGMHRQCLRVNSYGGAQ